MEASQPCIVNAVEVVGVQPAVTSLGSAEWQQQSNGRKTVGESDPSGCRWKHQQRNGPESMRNALKTSLHVALLAFAMLFIGEVLPAEIGIITPEDAAKLMEHPDPAKRPVVLDTRRSLKYIVITMF